MNVITNPPYGGDKVVQSDAQIKRKKIKEYIKKELVTLKDEVEINIKLKQLKKIEDQDKQDKKDSDKTKVSVEMCSNRIIKYAKNNKLTGNDKESSSLILIMDLVDVNGTAIGVLKEGVFFNKTYKDIRKCLVENFNVSEIISVPQDQFENTSTKTSIVVFHNTKEKTTTVKFSELIVERYTEDKFEEINGEIVLTENKDDICGISDKLISQATKDEILKNPICSLNGKDYNKKVIVVGEGYELVKLGDICSFLPKSKRNASFGQPIGKYNFYTSSDKVQKCDIADYNEESLIIGSGGVANIKIDNIFSCSADNMILKAPNNRYLYNLIKGNMYLLSDGFTGSTLKHLSKDYLLNVKIPIPKSKQKITEWVDKISKPYDKKNKNQELIMKLEEEIKNKIKDIGDNEDCDEVELGSICDIVSGSKTNLQQYLVKNSSHKIIRTRNLIDSNDYLYLNDEGINKCKTKILNKGDILMSTFADSYICKIIPENFIGSTYNGGLFKINNLKISSTYFINYIMMDNFKKQIKKISGGSTVLLFNIDNLKKLKLKIPKNKKLIKDFEPLFQEIEKLQIEMKEAELEYKKLIKELSEEAIPSNKQIGIKSDNELNDLSEESHVKEPIIETSEKTPKITKNKSKTNSSVI
jgi:type I restriction enzyme S subunit